MGEVQHLGESTFPTNLSSETILWSPGQVREVPDSHVDIYLGMRDARRKPLFGVPQPVITKKAGTK